MLTGDNERVAAAVSEQVGADEYRAGLLPEDKLRAVEALDRERGPVAMVGDGINDAPALAAAPRRHRDGRRRHRRRARSPPTSR